MRATRFLFLVKGPGKSSLFYPICSGPGELFWFHTLAQPTNNPSFAHSCVLLAFGLFFQTTYVSMTKCETLLYIPCAPLTSMYRYHPQQSWHLEWSMASKVLSKPQQKIALYGYCMSTTSKVTYLVLAFCRLPKDTGSDMEPMGSILLPPKPYSGFIASFNCFLSNPI
jgi:hypothetical protein